MVLDSRARDGNPARLFMSGPTGSPSNSSAAAAPSRLPLREPIPYNLYIAMLYKSEAQPLSFLKLPHSSQKHPGWHQERFSSPCAPLITRHSPLSFVESTLTDKHRVLPCFGRDCPPASPLESTLTRTGAVTPLEATLTKNRGGGMPASHCVGRSLDRSASSAFTLAYNPGASHPFAGPARISR